MQQDGLSRTTGDHVSLDGLLLALYCSVADPKPWSQFLNALSRAVNARAATLVLRQPARGDRGDLYSVNTTLALEELYRATPFPFPDDPFAGLEDGVACGIFDRMDRDDFFRTRFYNELMKPDDNVDILALNVEFGESYTGSLRLTRYHPNPEFGLLEKSLLVRLYPHLRAALALYEKMRREHLENNAYIRAIDQLAFGVIIVNERGHVIRVNEMASRLMKDVPVLRVIERHLHAGTAAGEAELAQALDAVLRNGSGSENLVIRGETARGKPGRSLRLLLKPNQDAPGDQAAPRRGVAIFVSAEDPQRSVSIGTFAKMYRLTRAEVALVGELLDGDSIVDAAGSLGISENTARSQLRSIFAKTGTHRQTDLIRMVLTSLAIIG